MLMLFYCCRNLNCTSQVEALSVVEIVTRETKPFDNNLDTSNRSSTNNRKLSSSHLGPVLSFLKFLLSFPELSQVKSSNFFSFLNLLLVSLDLFEVCWLTQTCDPDSCDPHQIGIEAP